MTVTVFSACTTEGRIQSSSTVYATARSGGTFTIGVDATAGTVTAGQQFSTPNYNLFEHFLAFDTSSIPDTDIVSSVLLECYLVTDSSTTDFTLQARAKSWTGSSLTSADWVAGASLSGLTLLATLSTSGIGATGAFKAFTSDPNFLSVANLKTGVVEFMISSDRMAAGTTPTGNEFVIFTGPNDVSNFNRLTVTHAPPPLAFPPFQSNPPRIWSTYQ